QRALLQLNSRHRADALGSIEEAIALFARQTPAPASGIQRQAHNAMGRILAADNRWDEAIAAFQRAETLGAKEFGGQSYQAAVNRYWIARLQVAQDKVAEAKASFRNVLAIYEKSLGENHYETRQVKSRLGLLLCLRGEPDAGLAMLQSLLNQPVPADHADDLVSDFVRAKLGEIYNDRGDLAEAERMTKPVVMAADGDKPSQDRGMALLAHAHTLALRGRFNEAWQSHARAAAVFQSLGAARSGVGVYVPIMAVDIANMEGRPERAAVALASAAAVPQAAGQGPSRQLSLLQLEGDLRMVEGKPAAALLLYRQLIALLAQTPNGSSEHERLALVHLGEGRALLAMADLPAARQALEKALAHRVQTGVAHGIWPGQIRSYLALVLAQQGKHSEALAQQALARADLQSQQPLAAVFTAPLTQLEQVAAKRNGRD
uniref:tetratricopeptide repeat protein n=1 Tax=Chitinimonas sp. TaxID=1934313 RepID=UPI0035B09538